MTAERDDSQANDELNSALPVGQPSALDRVQELTWALVDDEINEDEFRLLENLLISDDEARDVYVDCIQLHTELLAHYSAPLPSAGTAAQGSPVLGFLNPGSPAIGAEQTGAADAGA